MSRPFGAWTIRALRALKTAEAAAMSVEDMALICDVDAAAVTRALAALKHRTVDGAHAWLNAEAEATVPPARAAAAHETRPVPVEALPDHPFLVGPPPFLPPIRRGAPSPRPAAARLRPAPAGPSPARAPAEAPPSQPGRAAAPADRERRSLRRLVPRCGLAGRRSRAPVRRRPRAAAGRDGGLMSRPGIASDRGLGRDQVLARNRRIARLYAQGVARKLLAERFGLSVKHVADILASEKARP